MIIKSLEELRRADDRTLRFTPNGLSLGGTLRPEDAAEHQQHIVAQLELAPAVADGTRRSFEHLRTVFAYGVLCYEIYTLVDGQALLVIEQALRDRFIEYHAGIVTFVDKNDVDHQVDATRYDQVYDFAQRHRNWKLRTAANHTIPFNGMINGLSSWARAVGLLRGQRNRGIEKALVELRNFVAHPNGYHLEGPVEAARTLADVAELINQLWGQPTADGRLYPAPIRRDVLVLSWRTDGATGLRVIPVEALTDLGQPADDDTQNVIVRAVHHPGIGRYDPDLRYFDARYEATRYPVDLLWGPGTLADTAAWHATRQPEADTIDYLDQMFVVRVDNDTLYLPMRPTVAAMLPTTEHGGTWHAVRADRGTDAWIHVRNVVNGACNTDGLCPNCNAGHILTGSLADVLDPTGPIPPLPPDISAPLALPRSRAL